MNIDLAKAKKISWNSYLLRFFFGGTVTTLAGLLGAAFGPSVGGLFLAFPSISIAALTLIQRNDGKSAVGVDAYGTSLGSLGLLSFGFILWKLAVHQPAWITLFIATLCWFSLSSGLWLLFRWLRHR